MGLTGLIRRPETRQLSYEEYIKHLEETLASTEKEIENRIQPNELLSSETKTLPYLINLLKGDFMRGKKLYEKHVWLATSSDGAGVEIYIRDEPGGNFEEVKNKMRHHFHIGYAS